MTRSRRLKFQSRKLNVGKRGIDSISVEHLKYRGEWLKVSACPNVLVQPRG